MATNIITAQIKGRSAIADQHAYQYDYGMILRISGVDLPTAYQVDFSNEPIRGTAYQQIGNADGVAIPDACFESGDDIFAWVYLHSGEDDGETVYQIMIPVYKRSKTSGETPTPAQQSAIDEAIEALNEAVESADASAVTATEAATAAAESAAQAATSAEGVEHYAQEAAASAEEAAGYVVTVSEYASQAAASATAAASSATTAGQSADEADTSADAAAISATNAAASATAASGSATTATQEATEAANSATAASGSASAAATSAANAAGSATQSASNATAASQSATAAAGSATAASGSATTASTKADEAAASATSAAASAAEAAETAAGITADLMNKADVITDTASGSVVSISDGMASPVLGLSVDIEPIQDLHGYDNPWPAGGGKNIIPTTLSLLKDRNTGGTWSNNAYEISGVTFTVNDNGTITVNGTSTAAIYFNFIQTSAASRLPITAGTYILHKTGSSDINISVGKDGGYWGAATTSDTTVTTDSDVGLSAYSYIASGKTLSNFVLKPMFEKGSTASAWQPYSNLCPISGRSEVNVTRTGKNLSSVSSHTGGQTTFWGTDWDELKSVLNALPAGTYSISLKGKIDSLPDGNSVAHGRPYITAMVNGTQKTVLSYSVQTDSSPSVGKVYSESGVFTISEDAVGKINHAYLYLDSSVSHTTGRGTYEIYDLQVELGSSASSYEPYQGQTVTIQLGQTVYGGTVDVTSGKLVINRRVFSPDIQRDLYWSGTSKLTFNIPDWASSNYRTTAICSHLNRKAGSWGALVDGEFQALNGIVGMRIPNVTDKATGQEYFTAQETAGTPVQFLFYCAPVEVTLTTQELDILFGNNNIWADSGNVSVDYRCDTKKYILKKIAEALNA